jgi:stage II sporulation protein D
VRRAAFLSAAACVVASVAQPIRTTAATLGDDDTDPAVSAPSQALRVLLGPGKAQSASEGFTFNGRLYRGSFRQTPDGVVSTVLLEEYLYSVVPREMESSWPREALETQAVCARTFVLQRSDPQRGYDVVPSELYQVYGGVESETPAARTAVDATRGLVVSYNGRYAQIAYSSCCGGHTEASTDAWGGMPIPYLGGVVCPYCTAAPNYRWQRELDLSSVESAFTNECAPYGALRELRVGDVDPSGRARTIELRCERGSVFVKGTLFRLRIGARALPSLLVTSVTPADVPQNVQIAGGGLGHGVGLCQWGARGMAQQRSTHRDILRFYFPGTDLTST